MTNKYISLPSVVLGFHGCDKKNGLNILNGKTHLNPSQNQYDWLGHGIYFWEQNPLRALQYAEEIKDGKQSSSRKIENPFVIGTIIDLGNCLNLTESNSFEYMKEAYISFEEILVKADMPIPENVKGNRALDCAVIMHIHSLRERRKMPSFDSVRGAFYEGKEVYPGAQIFDKTHIQICLRNKESILGYFLPQPVKKYNPYI